MVDDGNRTRGTKMAHRTATTPKSLISFREYYDLDEARRKKRGRVDPVRTIINHIDALTKKVSKDRNLLRRDRSIAQQNQALAYLALHLSKSKCGK